MQGGQMEKFSMSISFHGRVMKNFMTLILWIIFLPVIFIPKLRDRIVPMNILEFHKKLKFFLYSHVNGGKGMISIFLALTVSPLLMCTLIFVEYARIQSAQAIIEELMGSSIFSALAHYDPYLDERFGFMAVRQDQEESLDSRYQSYLEANVQGFGKAISLSGSSAEGKNSLIEPLVLRQEVFEYSELSVPINTLVEGLNIQELLDYYHKKNPLQVCKNLLDSGHNVIDITDSAINTAKSLKEYYDEAKKYGGSLTKYKAARKAYEDAYQALEEAKSRKNNGEEISLDSYISEVDSKARAFGTATDDLKERLSTLKGKERDFFKSRGKYKKALDELVSNTQEFYKNQYGKNTIEDPCLITYHEMNNQLQKFIDKYQKEIYNDGKEDDEKLEEQAKKLESYSAEADGKIEGYIVLSEAESIDKITAVLYGDLKNTIKGSGTTVDLVTSLKDLLYQIIGIKVLYDGSLDSNLDPSELINQSGVLDLGTAEITDSVVDLLSSIGKFMISVEDGDLLETLTALGTFLQSLVTFFKGIFDWASSRLQNLGRLLSGGDSLGKNFLLYGYGVYNMPNRTNYSDGSSLTGYEYSNIFEMAGGTYNIGFLDGDFWHYPKMYNVEGSDKLYKGAELEYLLTGSNSEKGAQVGTFFNGFLLRLVSNLPAIASSDWITETSVTGPFVVVVFVILLLLESFIDMILLVNKQSVSLIKMKAYMSTEGISNFAKDFSKCRGLNTETAKKIKKDTQITADKIGATVKNKINSTFGETPESSEEADNNDSKTENAESKVTKPDNDNSNSENNESKATKDSTKPQNDNSNSGNTVPQEPKKTTATEAMGLKDEKGFMKLDYGEHCLILMLLGTNQDQYLMRLQNLVQLEAKEKYKEKTEYHLNKAYTGITATTEYQLNEFVPITKSTGGFTLDCTKTLGY